MSKSAAAIIAVLFIVAVGCRAPNPDATIFHSGGWENASDAKAHLNNYKQVLVACIYEDRWEDKGPHRLAPHHFKGTVVKTYKGDWSVSERVAFVHYVDAPASTAINASAGSLVFVFANEHTNSEMVLDTGDFGNYDAGLERALQFLYPERKAY